MEASSAAGAQHQHAPLDLDDDFGPEARARCYTWPMQQFVYDTGQQGISPHMLSGLSSAGTNTPTSSTVSINGREPTVAQLLQATPCSSAMSSHLMPLHLGSVAPLPAALPAKKRRCRKKPTDQLAQKKPNPWGEESYSDLIARALESAPDGRLKLNEIYQWFSDNIEFFRDRSSQEDAAGWKNSIRHNLSLHSRFMRIQNEGAGKSSWWVINPDAKPGRNPRRQRSNTIETSSKVSMDRKRKGARKRVEHLRSMMHQGTNSITGSTVSISSHDMGFPSDDGSFDPFRPRTQSTLTSVSRVSPTTMEGFNDFDFPPWIDQASTGVPPIPSDIVDRTGEIRLEQCDPNSPSRYGRGMVNGMNGEQKQHEQLKAVKIEQDPMMQQPPSYQELNSVRSPNQLQNPLLRGQLGKLPNQGNPYGNSPFSPYGPWTGGMPAGSIPISTPHSCASQQNSAGALPVDLENLTLPDQPLDMDMEAVLRLELSQTNNQLNFDI